ncbi:hypothetical protein D3C83_01590 [compost metagenome]
MAGTCGRSRRRAAAVTPSARSLSARMCGMPVETGAKNTEVSPEVAAVSAGPPPLYDTCSIFTLTRPLKYSAARCVPLPVPAEEKLIAPGRAFASATSSRTERAGSEGCTVSTKAEEARCVTGAKSVKRS